MPLRTPMSLARSNNADELCGHLEPRVLLAIADLSFSNNKATFIDLDGDTVTVKLTGPGIITGHSGDDVNNNGLADLTLSNTTLASKLSISVTKGVAGDGFISVGNIDDIVGSGDLGAIDAPQADLHACSLHLTGGLKSLAVRDMTTVTIAIDGSLSTPLTVTARNFYGGAMILGARVVTSVTFNSIFGFTLNAGVVGTFKVKASAAVPDSGNMQSFTVALTGVAGVKTTLGSIVVDGSMFNGSVNVTGTVGTQQAGSLYNGGLNATAIGAIIIKRTSVAGADGSLHSYTYNLSGIAAPAKTLKSFNVEGAVFSFGCTIHGLAGSIQFGNFNQANLTADAIDSFKVKRSTAPGAVGEFFQATLNVGTMSSTGVVLKSFSADNRMASATISATGRIGSVVGTRFEQAALIATQGIDSIVVKSSPLVVDSGQVVQLNVNVNSTPASAKSVGSITVQGAASQLAVFASGRIGPVKVGDLINASFQSPGSIDSITSAATIQGLFVAGTYGPIKAAGFMEATMTATGVTTKGVSFDSINGGAATLNLTTPQELLAQGRITTLNFSSISSLDIQAGSLGTLKVAGDAVLGTVNLTDTTRPQALDTFTAGFVLGSMQIAGNAGDFKFSGMTDFKLAVGTTLTPEQVAGLGSSGLPPAAAGLFTDAVHGVIKSFTVPHPAAGSPSNAGNPNLHVYSVVARRIKSLTLFHGFATNLNFDKSFGIATTFIDKATIFSVATPTATDKFTSVDANSLKLATISMPNHGSENPDRFDFDLGNNPVFIQDAVLRLYKV